MSQTAIAQADWGGAASPFGVTWQKMMMWFFIVTDALLFAGLLVSYGVVRIATGDWPQQSEVFSLPYIAAMTLSSSARRPPWLARWPPRNSNDGRWSPCVCG